MSIRQIVTIVTARDKKTAALLLTEILGLTAPAETADEKFATGFSADSHCKT